jgi:hypothetical protein
MCLLVALSLSVAVAAQGAETLAATASVTQGGKTSSSPVTVTLTRLSTDAERTELMAAIKKGGTAAARDLLAGRAAVGTVQLGKQQTPVKYAFARSMGAAGRLITVVTAQPIPVAGTGLPEMTPRQGYDLGLLLLEVPDSGTGQGEMSPAAKIRLNDQGGVVTEDSAAGTVVRLSGIAKK